MNPGTFGFSAGTPGGIKSIQRGVALTTGGSSPGTVTVSAVNMAKSELRMTGQAASSVGDLLAISLTGTTTITLYTASGASVGATCRVAWELTEWY